MVSSLRPRRLDSKPKAEKARSASDENNKLESIKMVCGAGNSKCDHRANLYSHRTPAYCFIVSGRDDGSQAVHYPTAPRKCLKLQTKPHLGLRCRDTHPCKSNHNPDQPHSGIGSNTSFSDDMAESRNTPHIVSEAFRLNA